MLSASESKILKNCSDTTLEKNKNQSKESRDAEVQTEPSNSLILSVPNNEFISKAGMALKRPIKTEIMYNTPVKRSNFEKSVTFNEHLSRSEPAPFKMT